MLSSLLLKLQLTHQEPAEASGALNYTQSGLTIVVLVLSCAVQRLRLHRAVKCASVPYNHACCKPDAGLGLQIWRSGPG